jgi:hypothetical protein
MVVGPDIRDLHKVKNFTGVQAYYLARELRKRGVDLHFIQNKNPTPLEYFREVDGAGCDHVLALGLRYFTHQPLGCALALAKKVPGKVTQLHDGLVHEYLMPYMEGVDCTFCFRDDSERTRDYQRYEATNHYIGWAADPDLLYPQQDNKVLRILIDHPYYKSGTPDITAEVTQDVMRFAHSGLWRDRFEQIKVRRLINGGAETVTLENCKTEQFDRKHVPFAEIAQEYRKAHVYMVTHKESVGLTCLELGYCGALTVASKGLIYQDRLDTVRHVQYEGMHAPWSEVLAAINVPKAVLQARKQTWGEVADRMLEWFDRCGND